MGYTEDLIVDIAKLDEECVMYAGLFDNWSRVETEAKRRADAAKDRLNLVESEVELEYRQQGIDGLKKVFRLENVTESAIKMLVTKNPRVRAVKAAFLEARHGANVAETARRALEKKGDRIENLVRLHGQGYFGNIQGKATKDVIYASLKTKYAEAVKQAGLADDSGGKTKKTKKVRGK
jgi:hypothetical protein